MSDEVSDLSILIVDDDEPNRYTLARRLTRDGFANLGMASNGVEALASLRQDKFDLVLLDIMMPELDGFGVLEAMKADPDRRRWFARTGQLIADGAPTGPPPTC